MLGSVLDLLRQAAYDSLWESWVSPFWCGNRKDTLTPSFLHNFSYTADEFIHELPQRIVDEKGQTSNLLKIIPLSNDEKLTIGILQFEPRHSGSKFLSLQYISEKGEIISEKQFASFSGDASEDIVNRIYYNSQGDPVVRGEYQISFNWSIARTSQDTEGSPTSLPLLEPQTSVAPTSTPAVPSLLMDLNTGATVIQEFSIEILSTEKASTNIYNIQLLNDNSALVGFEDIVSIPTPIIVNEVHPRPYPIPEDSTASPEIYPPPMSPTPLP